MFAYGNILHYTTMDRYGQSGCFNKATLIFHNVTCYTAEGLEQSRTNACSSSCLQNKKYKHISKTYQNIILRTLQLGILKYFNLLFFLYLEITGI